MRDTSNKYENIAVIRTNSMRHLTNYIRKDQLEKIFICFPDPHFKAANYRRRIINQGFLSEYAYVLKNKGRIYCITDVKDLHDWHIDHFTKHSLFQKVNEEELTLDPSYKLIFEKTEEGQKVTKNKGKKWACVYECCKSDNLLH